MYCVRGLIWLWFVISCFRYFVAQNKVFMLRLREKKSLPFTCEIKENKKKNKTVHYYFIFHTSIKSHFARLLFRLLFSVDWSKPGVWFRIKSAPSSAAPATWQLRSEFWQILRMHFILLPPSFISLAPIAGI